MNISQEEFRQLLDRYLKGTASIDEREMLDRFFRSYRMEGTDLESDPVLRDELLHGIHNRIRHRQPRRSFLSLGIAIAAAVGIFVVAWLFITTPDPSPGKLDHVQVTEIRTAPGEKLITQLPDGSRVYLNSNSKLSYSQDFAMESRQVSLSGEAFFEVVRDVMPFVVHSDHISTRVLGTSFNVRNRTGENGEITLVEGKVTVIIRHGEEVTLQPNEQAFIQVGTEKVAIRKVNVLRYTSWKENVLFFDRTPLAEAIRKIESWYGVTIDIKNPALSQCVITAKYQSEPLGNVLSSFQFLLDLKISRVSEKHYNIDGRGCK